MKQIKLMADYQCWPLWWTGGEEVGDIDPSTLTLSEATRVPLLAWAEQFDSRLNMDDPANSPEVPEAEEQAFERQGHELWLKLRQELEGQYQVSYFSQRDQRVYEDPAQYQV